METLAGRLAAARKRRVMTQVELAAAADVGLMTVGRLESGAVENPRPETIRRLAKALDVDPAWLLFGDDAPEVKAAA